MTGITHLVGIGSRIRPSRITEGVHVPDGDLHIGGYTAQTIDYLSSSLDYLVERGISVGRVGASKLGRNS